MQQELYANLGSIGISVSSTSIRNIYADIERTLIAAACAVPNDPRLLSLCLSWISVYGEKVNLDRVKKLAQETPAPWLILFAKFGLFCRQSRWKVLLGDPGGVFANGDIETAKLRISLRGEEAWAKDSGFLIPVGSEPIDKKWILAPERLAKVNRHFRNKLIYGANWRADIATALEQGAKNAFQAAKMSQSSYEPAHRVCADFKAAGWPVQT